MIENVKTLMKKIGIYAVQRGAQIREWRRAFPSGRGEMRERGRQAGNGAQARRKPGRIDVRVISCAAGQMRIRHPVGISGPAAIHPGGGARYARKCGRACACGNEAGFQLLSPVVIVDFLEREVEPTWIKRLFGSPPRAKAAIAVARRANQRQCIPAVAQGRHETWRTAVAASASHFPSSSV